MIDTFTECFNKTSKEKSPTKLDPSTATYDFENAIYNTEELGNDYYRNKSETVKGSRYDDQAALAQLIDKAKKELKSLGEQIKISLRQEGLDIPEYKVDEWIDDSISDTISDMQKAFQRCQPDGSVSGGGVLALAGSAGLTYAGASGALTAAGLSLGAMAAGTSVSTVGAVAAGEAALGSASAVGSGYAAMTAGAYNTALGVSSAVPIVGWAVAGTLATVFALKQWTNVFGATYGKHNADAGFYFERKSNSHSGNFGYDTKTLVNLFKSHFDEKLAAWKAEQKNKKTPAEEIKK